MGWGELRGKPKALTLADVLADEALMKRLGVKPSPGGNYLEIDRSNPVWLGPPPELPLAEVPTLDPTTGMPNVAAQRAKARALADTDYVRRAAVEGHERAAAAVCGAHGHIPRAGMCERCGGRLGRPI